MKTEQLTDLKKKLKEKKKKFVTQMSKPNLISLFVLFSGYSRLFLLLHLLLLPQIIASSPSSSHLMLLIPLLLRFFSGSINTYFFSSLFFKRNYIKILTQKGIRILHSDTGETFARPT